MRATPLFVIALIAIPMTLHAQRPDSARTDTTPQRPPVSKAVLQAALELIGLSYTDAELDLLLQVRGQKWIAINQGKEYVRIQGYIRPIDIQPDNSIESTKVANASISYGGKGPVASASAPGLLARFFNSKWMPF